MNTFERCIVRSHAIVLQTGNRVHTLFRHILLSQYDCQFLGTVITVVKEDDNIAFFDCAVYSCVIDRFDKFVGHAFVI